jgi:hypothetical protein
MSIFIKKIVPSNQKFAAHSNNVSVARRKLTIAAKKAAGIVGAGAATFGITTLGKGSPDVSRYTAQTNVRKTGEEVILPNGEKKVFIGYFGSTDEVATKIKEDGHQRELYTTSSKAVAQSYAEGWSAKKDQEDPTNRPVVSEVVADRLPSVHDYHPQRFEGPHQAISVDGLNRINASISEVEPVTSDNRMGPAAFVKRLWEDLKS